MKSFEDLLVWQKSLELAVEICQLGEIRGDVQLRAELTIAACSVPAYIADATSADTSAAFADRLTPAVSAAHRLDTNIRILGDMSIVPPKVHAVLEARSEEVRTMVVALQASARRGHKGPPRPRALRRGVST